MFTIVGFLFALSRVPLLGCQVSDTSSEDTPVVRVFLRLEGAPQRTLGLGERAELVVQTVDERGAPVSGVLVTALFEGPTHGGEIVEGASRSGNDGRATIVIAAPAQPASFVVRLAAPAAERPVEVQVVVDPERMGFAVQVDYGGSMALTTVGVSMYQGYSCKDAIWQEPTATIDIESAPPVQLWLPGAVVGLDYALVAFGADALGTVKATRCLAGQTPGPSTLLMELQVIALDLTGEYAAETIIDTESLAVAVTFLESLMGTLFVNQWMSAVLDGMQDAIAASDSAAAAEFALVRAEAQLDSLVVPAYAEAREIHLEEASHALFVALRQTASSVVLHGTLIGAPQTGLAASFVHRVDSLELTGGAEPRWVALDSPVEGDGIFVPSVDDPNDVWLTPHRLDIGMGTVFRAGLMALAESASSLPGGGLAGALDQVIECAELAAVVDERVPGVTSVAILEQGCIAALDEAETNLLLATEVMDEGSAIRLSGKAVASDAPGVTSAMSLLGYDWAATWGATAVQWSSEGAVPAEFVTVGPMLAVFEAERMDAVDEAGSGL